VKIRVKIRDEDSGDDRNDRDNRVGDGTLPVPSYRASCTCNVVPSSSTVSYAVLTFDRAASRLLLPTTTENVNVRW
jgi:hypothetical protein